MVTDWKPVNVHKCESFFVKPEAGDSRAPAVGISGPSHYFWLKGTTFFSSSWKKYVCLVINIFQRNNLENMEIERCGRNSFSCMLRS